jgi:AcrR family transcriptional regulator
MEVFWALGYEGTTVQDLQKAMGGITPTSLYAAFGSKEKLFREAVELSARTIGAPPMLAFTSGATARASIEGMLRAYVASVCLPGKPRGCLLVLGAINCTQGNHQVQAHLRSLRQLRPRFIKERLERGLAEGDVPKGTNLDQLASFYTAVMNGLSVQARDGAPREELLANVDCAMAAWDAVVGKRSGKRPTGSPAA